MKPTSQSIFDLLNNSELLADFNSLKDAKPTYEVNETTLDEAYSKFEQFTSLILKLMDIELFDSIATSIRSALLTNISAISNNLKRAKSVGFNFMNGNVPNHSNQIIVNVEELETNISRGRLWEIALGSREYQKEVLELSEARNQYKTLLEELKNVGLLHTQSNELFQSTKLFNSQTKELLEESSKDSNELRLSNTTGANLLSLIDQSHQSAKQIEEDLETKKLKVTAFYNNIEEYETQISDNTDGLNSYIADTKNKFQLWIEEKNINTQAIVDKNTGLQTEINTILQGATAGKLYEAFKQRQKDIEDNLQYWLGGVIATAGFAVALAAIYLYNGEIGWNSKLIFKVLSAIPFIALEFFLVKQYNERKDLVEQYAFKAAISLSFLSYREVMDAESKRTDNKSLDFVIETVRKIYEPPFPKEESKKNITDKYLEFADKHTDKVLDIVGKKIEQVKS
ncbi:MAG TPA: hypothetical protein VK154_04120 [Chitinophagales bacterium]|nr:hypothetical protein [Chitinophagales bacterium]